MAVNGADVNSITQEFDSTLPLRNSTADSISPDLGEGSNLPTEDFLASIGLQPRNAQNSQQSARRNSTMPPGWRRRLVQRKGGKTAGRFDMYIYSPQGQQFRSKTELENYIKKNDLDVNIGDFNFTVRDKGLLDITSNVTHGGVTHGGIESLKRKRAIDETTSVGESDPNDSLNSKPIIKRPRLNQTVNGNVREVGLNSDSKTKDKLKSRSNVMNKLVVRMKFSKSPAKTKMNSESEDLDSSLSTLNNRFDSPNTKKSDRTTFAHKNGLTKYRKNIGKKLDSEKGVRHVSKVNNNGEKTGNGLSNEKKSKSPSRKSNFTGIKPANGSSAGIGVCNMSTTAASDEHWVPPQSPFNLVEESLYYSSWRLLIATLLLEKGQDPKERMVLWEFFRRWPTVELALGATWQQVHRRLEPFGVDEELSKTLVRFSEEYLSKNWQYPCELYGVKKYGNDAYRIFCINEWKQVAPDNPRLNEYHRWLWVNHRVLGIR